MLRPRGSNARGALRAHEELLVQILHEELVGSAVLCRRARCVSLLTASRDCTLQSGSDRIHVFTASESGAASERGGCVAARWRREENSEMSEQKQSAFSTRLFEMVTMETWPFELVVHSSHSEITAMNEELVVRARSSSGT
eukprot:5078557-Pleurochrysis_carterae.AAC.1